VAFADAPYGRDMPDPRRALGALGERLAADHLRRAGYRIVERNFRTRYGELDIVAAGERCLVFCEVKTRVRGRANGPEPFDAIGHDKRRRLRRMAAQWLVERRPALGQPAEPDLRFDAIGISISPSGRLLALDHLEDAF
jgi:putative endonuclease